MPPTYPPDADDDAKSALLDAFEAQMESYWSDLSLYETWLCKEKSAKAILLASMEIDLSRSLRGLATSHLMWDHLRHSYEICNEAMYLAVVEEAQSLRQLDSTVEDFHQVMPELRAEETRLRTRGEAERETHEGKGCLSGPGDSHNTNKYHHHRTQHPNYPGDARHLTPPFETKGAEVMPELRAEETRLRAAGVSCAPPQPSVLAATPPQASPPLSQPSPVVAGVPSGVQCGYCKLYGHEEKDCRKKQCDRQGHHSRRSSQGSSKGTRFVSAAEQEVLALFRRLTIAAQASAPGTTAQSASETTAQASCSAAPPPPPSGTSSPWFLDSGASFHMTPHSTHIGVDAFYMRLQVQDQVVTLHHVPSEVQLADFFIKAQDTGPT
ncbi:unnamed protein product [Miscanthus lutarioriparius]|uniref:Uncharacterized protein n=1 Tax=Miscanthus lutarioriparius TaxID=422564 RepID=A0A811RC50_9POAL|nr:unnamed protein product [Miscanthus lutarioriparius]